MAVFISIVKYLNHQSSVFPSQAASSQASSAREPLNSLTFLASRSAISPELAWSEPVKIIKRKALRYRCREPLSQNQPSVLQRDSKL